MCVAVRRWTEIVPEKETVAPPSSATDSTSAACRRREFPTTGVVQGKISDNTRMLHRRGSHTRVKSMILWEKELLTVMWRDGLNSLKRTENPKPGFQRGEPPGKRKTQTIQRPAGKKSAKSLGKWSKLDLHKAAKNKHALSYLFPGVFMAAEQATWKPAFHIPLRWGGIK